MKEIETQLKQSTGVDPCITTSYASDIDLWLKRWETTRGINIRNYSCLLSSLGRQEFGRMKIFFRK